MQNIYWDRILKIYLGTVFPGYEVCEGIHGRPHRNGNSSS